MPSDLFGGGGGKGGEEEEEDEKEEEEEEEEDKDFRHEEKCSWFPLISLALECT